MNSLSQNSRAPWRASLSVIGLVALIAAGCAQAGDDQAADGDPDGTGGAISTVDAELNFVNEPPSDASAGGELAFGLDAETDGWDVTSSRWAGSAYTVGGTIYDPLAVYDSDLRAEPYLAESWEHNDDFTEWRIHLREGAEFHDGTPVDAEAVAINLQTHQESALTNPAVSFLDTVSAEDDLTVLVEMEKPWSTFPDVLASQIGYVMAPSMIEAEDGSLNPVGSGPFVFESWTPDQDLRVSRNENYWRDGLPYLDSIHFQVMPDGQTRSRSLDTGQIDALRAGGTDAAQIVRFAEQAADGELQMFADDNLETEETFVAFNVEEPPFDDPLARRAVAYALDRQALSDQAYEGLFPPAYGPYMENSPFYHEADVPRYDPDRARELAEEYEEKHGEPLSFTANILPEPSIQRIAQTLQQQAQEVGIQVELDAMDQTSLIVAALSGNYEATGFILFGSRLLDRDYVFIADYPEDNDLNFTNNVNPEIIDALDTARETDDEEVWDEQFARVQDEFAEDLNFLFLVHNLSAIVYDNDVFGLANWTLPDGEPAGRSVTQPILAEVWIDR